MRKIVEFACSGETLYGTLDPAEGATGLLIVSGGNEIRAGAHRGMAMLAARIAAEGTPVFRFDRRGVGDSTGANAGHSGSRPDLEAALAAFRNHARVRQVIGFGMCDAATALLLFGDKVDRLVLANPWLRDETDGLPNVDAIRARYAERLRDPHSWGRALTGRVNLARLASGLSKLANAGHQSIEDEPEASMFRTLKRRTDTTVLISAGDATGIAFLAAAERRDLMRGIALVETDSHSFAREGDEEILLAAIRAAITDMGDDTAS